MARQQRRICWHSKLRLRMYSRLMPAPFFWMRNTASARLPVVRQVPGGCLPTKSRATILTQRAACLIYCQSKAYDAWLRPVRRPSKFCCTITHLMTRGSTGSSRPMSNVSELSVLPWTYHFSLSRWYMTTHLVMRRDWHLPGRNQNMFSAHRRIFEGALWCGCPQGRDSGQSRFCGRYPCFCQRASSLLAPGGNGALSHLSQCSFQALDLPQRGHYRRGVL